jgi:hypothetical protein
VRQIVFVSFSRSVYDQLLINNATKQAAIFGLKNVSGNVENAEAAATRRPAAKNQNKLVFPEVHFFRFVTFYNLKHFRAWFSTFLLFREAREEKGRNVQSKSNVVISDNKKRI